MTKYIALTCSEDTNDFIESINGQPVNLSIEDYLTANPTASIENGGTEYYPDLVVPELEEGIEVELVTTGATTVQLVGGQIPQRPR